jgi:hypothetical protein
VKLGLCVKKMAAELKFMRRTADYTHLDYENNSGIMKELNKKAVM